ncbi:MAG: flagellar M-ring protein FliF C-terminal domain-containing protein [Vulcanimicrobiota bacterium]
MATGIQTSVQRSRRSQLSAQTSSRSPWSKPVEWWGGLSRRVKSLIGGLLLVLLIAGLFGAREAQSKRFGDLYPLKLNTQDVTEISAVLSNSGIDHTVTPAADGIQLHPTEIKMARALLAGRALPRHLPEPPKDDSKLPTADMRKAEERRRLESELVSVLRQMDGINDARVTLALPPRSYFRDELLEVKASVFLKLAPDYSVSQEVARGITSLISHSVPELKPENVSLLDDNGAEIAGQSLDGLDSWTEHEVKLQTKLQNLLTRAFGDRAHAVVNVEFDYSQDEHRSFTPGPPEYKGVIADSSQLIEEFLDGESKENGKKFGSRKEARNFVYAQNSHINLRMKPKISRITATVLLDGASEDEVRLVNEMVKGAIGVDESRSDQVFVSGLPWNRDLWKGETTPVAPVEVGESGLIYQALGLSVGMFLLGLVGAGLLHRRTRPVMGVSLGNSEQQSVNDIVDHRHQKTGVSTSLEHTTSHGSRMEALESLVHCRPKKAAELLRTTWLKG